MHLFLSNQSQSRNLQPSRSLATGLDRRVGGVQARRPARATVDPPSGQIPPTQVNDLTVLHAELVIALLTGGFNPMVPSPTQRLERQMTGTASCRAPHLDLNHRRLLAAYELNHATSRCTQTRSLCMAIPSPGRVNGHTRRPRSVHQRYRPSASSSVSPQTSITRRGIPETWVSTSTFPDSAPLRATS